MPNQKSPQQITQEQIHHKRHETILALAAGMAAEQTRQRRAVMDEKKSSGIPFDHTRASALHSCARRMYLDIVERDRRPGRSCATGARLEEGIERHAKVKRQIVALARPHGWWPVGFERERALGEEIAGELRRPDTQEIFCTYHLDMMLTNKDGLELPIEIKSTQPVIFDRFERVGDFDRFWWSCHYIDQLLTYMFARDALFGMFVLSSLDGRTSLPFLDDVGWGTGQEHKEALDASVGNWVVDFEQYSDRILGLLEKAEHVHECVKRKRKGEEPLEDGSLAYCNDWRECEHCWTRHVGLCVPPQQQETGSAAIWPASVEEIADIERMMEIETAGKEHAMLKRKLDKIIKAIYGQSTIETVAVPGTAIIQIKRSTRKIAKVPEAIRSQYLEETEARSISYHRTDVVNDPPRD